MRRGIIVGHRDYRPIALAIRDHLPFHVLTGFMPSGHPHLGHLLVMREVVWHVSQGGHGMITIADREAHRRTFILDAAAGIGQRHPQIERPRIARGTAGVDFHQMSRRIRHGEAVEVVLDVGVDNQIARASVELPDLHADPADRLIVATAGGKMQSYDITDPRSPVLDWEITITAGSIEATPAAWDGMLYIGSRDGFLYAVGD